MNKRQRKKAWVRQINIANLPGLTREMVKLCLFRPFESLTKEQMQRAIDEVNDMPRKFHLVVTQEMTREQYRRMYPQ